MENESKKFDIRDYPQKVRFGYLLMGLGSILFFFLAAYLIVFLCLSGTKYGPIDWTKEDTIAYFVVDLVVIILAIPSGISGLSFINHKKFLVWFASFAAFVSLVICLDGIIELVAALIQKAVTAEKIAEFAITFPASITYFFGWWISKDYFED